MKTESPMPVSGAPPPSAQPSQHHHPYTNPLTHLMNLTPSSPALNPLAALSVAGVNNSAAAVGSPTTPLRTSLSEVRSPFTGMEPGHQRRRSVKFRRLVGRAMGPSVCHNFLKWREVSKLCSYRSTSLD